MAVSLCRNLGQPPSSAPVVLSGETGIEVKSIAGTFSLKNVLVHPDIQHVDSIKNTKQKCTVAQSESVLNLQYIRSYECIINILFCFAVLGTPGQGKPSTNGTIFQPLNVLNVENTFSSRCWKM